MTIASMPKRRVRFDPGQPLSSVKASPAPTGEARTSETVSTPAPNTAGLFAALQKLGLSADAWKTSKRRRVQPNGLQDLAASAPSVSPASPTYAFRSGPSSRQIDPKDSSPDTLESAEPTTQTSEPAPAQIALSMPDPKRHLGRLKAGQSVYVAGRDLIVMGDVDAGATASADGSIYVFGRLAGNAHAGASGKTTARVYALDFQASQIAIAGHFCDTSSIPENRRGWAMEAGLDAGRLSLTPICKS